jgi:23S rRNA (guanine2445-N2)-methyltransferase / 23S rRNA (guanine2069-N7)-methyltransferase
MSVAVHDFFATTAKGLEDMLAGELRACGARAIAVQRAGVSFRGPLEVAYRACLWSRVANRVLLPLASFAAPTPQALYDGGRRIPWLDHLSARHTLAVDCVLSDSAITHSHFAALRTKDAIVDCLRDRTGQRPSVDVRRPDVRVNVYLHANRAIVSIDLSGDSLHRRGYREARGAAPLKETLAAGLLLLADWPALARCGVPLLDPMCGSGTIPIEAALIAGERAPGRAREHFGFTHWRGHQPALWRRLLDEADARVIRDSKRIPAIRGDDVDARAVRTALANVERAGLRAYVHMEKRALADCQPIVTHRPPTAGVSGLLVTNPPYGERLGDQAALPALYATFGDVLRRRFLGWTAYVLAGNRELAKHLGLRAARRHVLYNGAIECRLLALPISSAPVQRAGGPRWRHDKPGQSATTH